MKFKSSLDRVIRRVESIPVSCSTHSSRHIAGDGVPAKYAEIDRRPVGDELKRAYDAAGQAGLWRFDERWEA